jgi:hypothetical protein
MKMYKSIRVKRISLGSAVKTGAFASAIFGFICGILLAFVTVLFSTLLAVFIPGDYSSMGFLALIIFPLTACVFFGFAGLIVSFVLALIFNISSGIFGGIEIEAEEIKKYEYNDTYGVI